MEWIENCTANQYKHFNVIKEFVNKKVMSTVDFNDGQKKY